MTPRQLRGRLRRSSRNQSPEDAVRRLLRRGADRATVVQALLELEAGSLQTGEQQTYARMLRTAERYAPRVRQNPLARQNFFGLFKSKPPAPTFDLAEHVQIATDLSGQAEHVRDYLVHAPGKGGKGKAWYWLPGIGMRAFESAKAGGFPRRYIEAPSPWSYVKMNLGMYRDSATRPFVVIDTFSGEVEGPLTLGQIQGRKNPRRKLARRNQAGTRLAYLAGKTGLLLGQLQGIKAGAWLAHWNAGGVHGYADHLLFERIYTEMDELIDTLAEKHVAYFRQPVPPSAVMPTLNTPLNVAALVAQARVASDELRKAANKAYDMRALRTAPSGLDDYLMSLNNKLDTFYYLLTDVRGR